MMKKIFYGVGILILLVIGAAVALPFLFKDKIIGLIKTEANNHLKAKLDFSDVNLSLIRSFPDFSLDLYDFSLVGVEEFDGDTLVYIKDFEFTIDLMSVIKGENIQIKSLVLDQPSIMAKVLKGGKANWDIAVSDGQEEAAPTEASEPAQFKAALKKFEIRNGRVVYDDRDGDMYAELAGLNHNLKGDFTQDNFLLKTMTTIDALTYKMDGVKMLAKVNTKFKADLDMDMANMKFTFKDNEIQMNQLFLGFDGWLAMPGDDIDMDLTWFSRQTDFKNILSLVPAVYAKDFEDVKTSGKLALNGHVKGKFNETSMPGFGLKLLVDNAMFQYPDLPKAVKNININLLVDNQSGNPDHTVIDLKRFYMEMADNPFEMRMKVTTPESDANIDGEFKGKISLGSLKDIMPLEAGESMTGTIISDITMKGRMSSIEKEQYEQFNFAGSLVVLDMDYQSKNMAYDVKINKAYLNFSPRQVELSTFESKIGKSDINANGKIANFLGYMFKDEDLTGTFNMNSKLMDLNEFMAEDPNAAPAQTAQDATTAEEPMSVVEVPSNINFTLTASIAKMLYDNMEIANVNGAIKIADSKIDMKNLRMNLLDGSMTMNGSYSTQNPKQPEVAFLMDVNNFDVQKTVKTFNTVQKMAPVAEKCHGKFSTSMSFNGLLDDKMEPVMNSLNGKGSLSTAAIVVNNFEPINKMADALKMDNLKKMTFNDLKIAFEFKDGKVIVEPFDTKIKNINARVGGSTSFEQEIDYTWNLDIPRSEFGGAANQVLTGLVSQVNAKGANMTLGERVKMDVFVGGTVTNPTVRTGLKESAANMADDLKNKAKEELDKKKAELEAKAREEADKLKKDAEDRARAEAEKAKAAADKAKAEAEARMKAEQDRIKAEADKAKKEAEEKAKKEAQKQIKGLIKP